MRKKGLASSLESSLANLTWPEEVASPRSHALVLSVFDCIGVFMVATVGPTFTIDEIPHLRESKHHPRPLLSCTPEVSVAGAGYVAMHKCESTVVCYIFSGLCCDHSSHPLCNRFYNGVPHHQ